MRKDIANHPGRGPHGAGRGNGHGPHRGIVGTELGAPTPGDPGERGMGHGMGWGGRRMFGSGGVKLAVLKLLSEEPAHGYQLIKKMEERLAGGYTPSAGAIYPTLSLLEDEGLIAATQQENRKMYSVTAEGTSYLEANKARVEAIFAHLEEAGRVFARGRTPELTRALDNLRGAVSARVTRGNATPEQFRKMAEAIDLAAKSIDAL